MMGSNSLGIAFVTAKNRVPNTAMGKTALQGLCIIYVRAVWILARYQS